ncbi:MAG: flavin reductase family protein [Phycisphaeraceae bacterium]|nr:flavin reductase family protein [Phycisphaerae bacterium]MBX3391807.1 flavin reductase family protein [Phycisphaeraceae bacterium]HRJ50976.1 flavin reductase family protein [Phycisphaerales bacterium]
MELSPDMLCQADRYKLLIGCVVPRPIALVSTVSRAGALNAAPFSFFNGVGSDPMMLLFCPANKPDGGEKDTLRNAAPEAEGGVGEFVVNIVGRPLAERMAACAEPLGHGESEFSLSGLTAEPSRVVVAPRVAEAAVCFECRTDRVIRTNPGRPAGGNVVIGLVVHVRVRDGILDDRFRADPALIDAVGRMGGLQYCTTRHRFEMPMGRAALDCRPE